MALQYTNSWTQISNLALSRFPIARITSVDPPDGSKVAGLCAEHLPAAIDEVLIYHDWIGMTKRVSLEQSEETPAFDYAYFYQVPPDLLRILSVDSDVHTWRQEQDQIATDALAVDLAYIFRPVSEDVLKIPVYLRTAIGYVLADRLTMPLTADEEKIVRIAREKEQALGAALEADSSGQTPNTVAEQLGYTWADEVR